MSFRAPPWVAVPAFIVAAAVATAACGDDPASPSSDAGADGPTTPDNPNNPNNPNNPDGGGDGATDAADGGPNCTFASYVINLIATQTTPSALPDTTLGANCQPSTSQDDFKSLF